MLYLYIIKNKKMGKYINSTSKRGLGSSFSEKCIGLVEDGAVQIKKPDSFQENLICVVDNGMFAAAGYAYDRNEFAAFNSPSDTRIKAWFTWDKVKEYAQ